MIAASLLACLACLLSSTYFGLFDCRWQKCCPTANFLIKYSKRETGNALDGDSAMELSTANYGRDEWWLLLDETVAESSV